MPQRSLSFSSSRWTTAEGVDDAGVLEVRRAVGQGRPFQIMLGKEVVESPGSLVVHGQAGIEQPVAFAEFYAGQRPYPGFLACFDEVQHPSGVVDIGQAQSLNPCRFGLLYELFQRQSAVA